MINISKLKYILLFIVLFVGCTQPKTIVKTDTIVEYKYNNIYTERVDSVYVDKWHNIYIKGDTVRITDSIVSYKYKLLKDTAYVYDTVYKANHEAAPTVKTVTKPVWWPVWVFVGLEILLFILIYYFRRNNFLFKK